MSRWCSERQMELIKIPPSLIEMLSVDLVPVGRVTQPATQVLPEAGSTKLIWSPVWIRPCACSLLMSHLTGRRSKHVDWDAAGIFLASHMAL